MLFKNLFKPIEMYIIEVYECHGADIVSSLDYYTHFETKEECQAYCDYDEDGEVLDMRLKEDAYDAVQYLRDMEKCDWDIEKYLETVGDE